MSEWIGTKDAMRLLGVGSTTIKRWADADKLPFIRTAGGHRRFRRSAVEQLLRSRHGEQADTAAAYRWVRWLRTRDAAFINTEIAALRSELGDWFRVADFLGVVATEIGECWADAEFSMVDERIASARLELALATVSGEMRVTEDAPVCLLATLEGERHSLGLWLTRLCLSSAGFDTQWAGVDLPVAAVVEHIRDPETSLDVVALSASRWMSDYATLRRGYRDIAAACRERNIVLVIGGRGAWPHDLDYGHRCHSFEELEQKLSDIEAAAPQP